jgi:hypothetical protein
MKLLTLQEISPTPLDTQFKQSPLVQLIAALLFVGLIVGALCWHCLGDFPLGGVIFTGGFFGLFAWISFPSYIKSRAPTNWILSIGPDRILVKFRSYLNPHFPQTDPQVVQLHPSEIYSACITKQRITAPGSRGGNTTSFHTFLDLNTTARDLSPLKEQLVYERNLKMPVTGTFVKSSGKSQHYPVSVVDNRTVRIEWRSPQDIVTPAAKKALDTLNGQGIHIEALHKEVIDLTRDRTDHSRMEDNILLLAERGNRVAAVKLARRTYGFDITEAKEFVEGLLK